MTGHNSSDDETVKDDREGEHIAELLEEEIQQERRSSTPVPLSNGAVANRYHELLEAEDTESAAGSAEGLPPRPASPGVDSLLSVPDDLPSAQVC